SLPPPRLRLGNKEAPAACTCASACAIRCAAINTSGLCASASLISVVKVGELKSSHHAGASASPVEEWSQAAVSAKGGGLATGVWVQPIRAKLNNSGDNRQ